MATAATILRILLIINDPRYATERSCNDLRLALALLQREDRLEAATR